MKVTVERLGSDALLGKPAKHIIVYEQIIDQFTNTWDARIIFKNDTYSLRKVAEYIEILE